MSISAGKLRRNIGLPLLLFYGLGNILGAGIYVLIGKVAGEAGIYTPVAFFIASLVATFSAFSYGEMSSRYPLSAGEAIYVDEGFNIKWLSRLTGMLIAIAGMISAAAILRGFYGYFSTFFDAPETLVVSAIVLLLGLLIIWGITQSVATAALLTVVEIAGLLIVIWAGKDALANIHEFSESLFPPVTIQVWSGILLGAFLAFYAFIGFEDMVNIAEEVKNPERNMPAAILLALLIATVLYAMVALVAVSAMNQNTLADSMAPLADIIYATSNMNPKLISLISMIAIINGALIQMIMASRILYGMAGKGWLWSKLSTINHSTRTPINASWAVTFVVLVLALWFPVETLARGTSFLILVVFTLVNVSLISVKRKSPVVTGVMNIPMWVPVAGFTSCISLILFQISLG